MIAEPTRTPRRPALRRLAPVVVLVAAAGVGGGVVARQGYRQPAAEAVPMVQAPAPSQLTAGQQPGDPVVRLTWDAAEHPDHAAVLTLFQRYVDAINTRGFDLWRSTVTTAAARLPSEAKWRSDLASTRDGSVVIERIDPAPGGNLRVLLAFVSTQDPQKAPADFPAPCIRWHVVYPVVREGSTLRIDLARERSSPQRERC